MKKSIAALALASALLTACQSTPQTHQPPRLSAQQVAVLEANGFRNEGADWYLGLPDRLLFPVNGSHLDAEQNERLRLLSKTLSDIGLIGARIEGHTDSTGAEAYNRQLSLQRANKVKQALTAGGMEAPRITTVGRGEADPIENNNSAQGRQENRRVVLIISADDTAAPPPKARIER